MTAFEVPHRAVLNSPPTACSIPIRPTVCRWSPPNHDRPDGRELTLSYAD
jgi:hypothetical protein